jgi:ComF family protein
MLSLTFVDRMRPIIERSEFSACDLVVPVPLSPQRLADRGFNQAEVIAHAVGKHLNRPVDSGSLVRNKHTPMHRAAMDRKARQRTVENAFSVNRPKLIEGRTILLVDDIYTSGSTASNCAKALKKKGADSVLVFTLARTI